MQSFVFTVKERSVAPSQHSWVAIEESSQEEIPLHTGGNTIGGMSYVGQYPEIQEFLHQQYDVDVSLAYVSQIDELTIEPDGKSRWVFRRQAAEVIVHDISRTLFRVTTRS